MKKMWGFTHFSRIFSENQASPNLLREYLKNLSSRFFDLDNIFLVCWTSSAVLKTFWNFHIFNFLVTFWGLKGKKCYFSFLGIFSPFETLNKMGVNWRKGENLKNPTLTLKNRFASMKKLCKGCYIRLILQSHMLLYHR